MTDVEGPTLLGRDVPVVGDHTQVVVLSDLRDDVVCDKEELNKQGEGGLEAVWHMAARHKDLAGCASG